jgi:hypothetical protein
MAADLAPLRLLARSLCIALAVHTSASGYEADVHFGLTKWLALQAGFDENQASAIALGNQRADGGSMDTQALVLEYACTSPDAAAAASVQRTHYPSATVVPAPAAQRIVVAGGPPSRAALRQLAAELKGRQGLMLLRFGEALHPLQDSWSHQGTPGILSLPGVVCDPALVSVPGGRSTVPHAPNLTRTAPSAALAMARASYEVLLDYPRIQGRARVAANWNALVAPVQQFAVLGTKSAKRDWFLRHGVANTSFLQGVSLPDGPSPGPLDWRGQFMPALAHGDSDQHDAPADARSFVDGFLARWLSPVPVEALFVNGGRDRSGAASRRDMRQLAARLKLWRWRDHGSAAALAHVDGLLSAGQLAAAERLTRSPRGAVRVASLGDALFPVQPLAPPGAPVLPYILRSLPPAADGAPRMLAMLRLRHAPYDTLGLMIERRGGHWDLVQVVSAVG